MNEPFFAQPLSETSRESSGMAVSWAAAMVRVAATRAAVSGTFMTLTFHSQLPSCLGVGFGVWGFSYGVTPWLEPANRRLPLAASTTVLALPVGVPSLAIAPSTITTSPIFIVSRRQPLRIRMFGLPISIPQLV